MIDLLDIPHKVTNDCYNRSEIMSQGVLSGDDLAAEIAAIRWFHSIDFGGLVSSGKVPLDTLKHNATLMFDKCPVAGKTVLDVGAWDGFFSFEAKRRGASRVLATDHWCWSGPGKGTKAGFDLAKKHLRLDIEEKDIDVLQLSPDTVGLFDVVIFSGVFYHLKNPMAAVEQLAQLVKETMIVETHLDAEDYSRPAMVFYPGLELAGDPTSWWGPNPTCVTEMLKVAGFRTVDFTRREPFAPRGYFHAWK